MRFTRPLSATERFYVAYGDIFPDFVMQAFFEGSGVLDLPLWEKAVEEGSRANPGSRLVLERPWAFTRWVDSGVTPPVRVAPYNCWDCRSSENAPAFMQGRLHSRTGPTCEVILMPGDKPKVCFRVLHAVMDGRGLLTWAADVFRALRGEPPKGSASTLSDFQAARTFQKGWRSLLPPEFSAPTGMPQGRELGAEWRYMRMPGRYKDLLPQVAVLLGKAARAHGGDKVRFAVPVDLRTRIPGLRSTGNLTNLLYLNLSPETTAQDIKNDLLRQLEMRTDGLQYLGDQLTTFIPQGMIAHGIRQEMARKSVTGRFRSSGVISSMGLIPLAGFQGGGFITDHIFGSPPNQQTVPIFVITVLHEEYIGLTISIPRNLAGQGRIDALMEHLRQGLVPD